MAPRLSLLVVLVLAPLCSAAAGPDGLTDLSRRARNASEAAERIEAIEALPDERPRRARVLAAAVEDESTTVRVRAIEPLVGIGEHDVAVEAFDKASKALLRERKVAEKELDEHVGGERPGIDPGGSQASVDRDLEAIRVWGEVVADIGRRLAGLSSVEYALAAGFIALPDDRGVAALVGLLDEAPPDYRSDALLEALLELGSADALRSASRHLSSAEKARRDIEGALKKARRAKPARAPKGADKGEWQASEEERLAEAIADHEEDLAELDAWATSLAERLTAFAKMHELASPPKSVFPARAWRGWGMEQAELLPASLGRG
ncbi:MAG: hypothetical protein AAF682_16810 [Planctomycetota bacterium]